MHLLMAGHTHFLVPKKKHPLAGADMVCATDPQACRDKGTKKAPYLCTMVYIKVSHAILKWVRWRAPHVVAQFPQFESWLKGEKRPTLKQIEKLAKKANIP